MKDLDDLRKEIDEIDEQMKTLFIQRMKVVTEVGLYKKAHQIPILNQNREDEMLKKHYENFSQLELWPYYEAFLKNVIRLSKEAQK